MTLPTLNLLAISPTVILVVAALLVLLADLVLRDKRPLGWLSLLALALAFAALVFIRPVPLDFQGMTISDGLAVIAGGAVLIAAMLGVLLALDRAQDFNPRPGPYYALMLLATAGMIAMAKGTDFFTIFLGLEIFSLALYILSGFARSDVRSGEASLKYFLLGAFASGFFLYGMALIYGATGTTSLAEMQQGIAAKSVPLPFEPLLPIGVALLIVGYGFKVALVPFHQWTPDVYQGAPTSVTAFMSVATKTAAFASLLRVVTALVSFEQPWLMALAVLAAVTMTIGNLAALRQTSLKRLLAYSSIAHAGYVLTGIAAGNATGAEGALYYLIGYTFMNLGAFAVILALQRPNENDITSERLQGLASRQPLMALFMAIFMFGLTGIPPLVGFFGKLYVFNGAVEAGLVWLAIIGVLNSAIAAYYYLRITVSMYMADPAGVPVDLPRTRWPIWLTVGVCAVATVVLGIWQFPWMQGVQQAVASLAMR